MVSFTSERDSVAETLNQHHDREPTRLNGVFIFMSKSRQMMKILYRGLQRFELTKIRLDKGKFLLPLYDEERNFFHISWSDYVNITEMVSTTSLSIRSID